MLMGKRIVVVLPAYRAEKTVEATYRDLPHDIVDTVLLVDDASPDRTVEAAQRLGVKVFIHQQNLGYGANQKTCYPEALSDGADITVMVIRIISMIRGWLRLWRRWLHRGFTTSFSALEFWGPRPGREECRYTSTFEPLPDGV